MSGLASFRIETDARGFGSVVVNGEDLTGRVSAWSLQNRSGQPPLLVLNEVVGDGVIEGEGVVHVQGSGGDSVAQVQEFLARVDPMELEKAVLSNMGYGDGDGSSMAIALRILREWAAGVHSPA